jgi:hypothetical protein
MLRCSRRSGWNLAGPLVQALIGILLLQACGQSGKSTGPSGNSSVAVGLKKASGQLPQGCTGVVTATGPVTRTGTLAANGQVTLAGLVPGTYVFSAILDCSPNGSFAGQSPPTEILNGVNSVTIEITTAPIAVGATCNPTTLNVGGTTNCSCNGSLVTGGAPTFSWSVSGPGAPGGSNGQNPSFTFPTAGSFQLVCTANNGGITKSAPPITVQVNTPPPQTGTIEVINGFSPGEARRHVAALSCGFGCIGATVNAGPSASGPLEGSLPDIVQGQSKKLSVPAGQHTVSAFCSGQTSGSQLSDSPKTVQVTGGQNTPVVFSDPSFNCD